MKALEDFPKTILVYREDDYLCIAENASDVADGTFIATYELVSTGTVKYPPPVKRPQPTIENVKMEKGK